MAKDKEDKKKARSEKKEQNKKEKEAKKAKSSSEDEEDEDEETTGGKVLVAFVAIIIVAIWLGILALLVKMDVGGFGSTVLYPILKDVPVINKILPDVEYADEDSQYNFSSMSEAIARIKELEAENKKLKKSSGASEAYVTELEADKAELEQYKANEAAFEEEKEKFYSEVVFSDNAPDISEYKSYYESIEPEYAEVLYKQVVGQIATDEAIEDYAKTYSSMKPAQAAAIFNEMTDNLELVAKILNAMDAESRGKILGAMDSSTAAAVTKIMNPSE